jgi:hypothetical protein
MSVLGFSCFFLFTGRAVQHFFFDAPFRVVLWNQPLLAPWVNRLLGMSWEAYAASPDVDAAINALTRGTGLLYAACAIASLPLGRWNAWRKALLAAGAFSLFLLAWMFCLEKFLRAGEFLEYACQWMAPVLLILAHSRFGAGAAMSFAARLAIAGTFIGHGSYAAGLYPVPGNFVDMVILHLGVGEGTARTLLFWMGMIDFGVAAGVLLPFRMARPFLIYGALWGALTALARFGFGFDATEPDFGTAYFLPEVLFRIPHAGLPLWLLCLSPPAAGSGISARAAGGAIRFRPIPRPRAAWPGR